MLNNGTYIRYGNYGVFQIKNIIEKSINKECKTYYVMETVYGVSTRITTPIDNPNIREILNEKAIAELLAEMPSIEVLWMEDKRLRKETFKAMISSNNPRQLAQVIKSIYTKQQEKLAEKKVLADDDVEILHHAEEILQEEIALSIHMDKVNVTAYILKNVAI